MMDILDIGSLWDEFIDAKGWKDKCLVYQNEPVNTKWVDMFAELEMNSYKSKTLWLLKRKILSVPSSKAFIVRVSS